jgi:2-methylcitrate dehydratase PrpD
MILRGRIGADEITGDGLKDVAVLALAARIKLLEDPDICARFPAERFAVATLQTTDGRTVRSEWVEAHGGPQNPLSDDELRDKFRTLTTHLGDDRSRAIENAIASLGTGAAKNAAFLADLILEPSSWA